MLLLAVPSQGDVAFAQKERRAPPAVKIKISRASLHRATHRKSRSWPMWMPTALALIQSLENTDLSGYITGNHGRSIVDTSQKRAIRSYRARLNERGLARFEVLGRNADRDLIRLLARRLSEDGADASRLRAVVSQTIAGQPPKKGGILAALRRSPLVDADLDLTRQRERGRKVDI